MISVIMNDEIFGGAMQELNEELIRQEVLEFWRGFTNLAVKEAMFAFKAKAIDLGFEVKDLDGGGGPDALPIPNFRSPRPDTTNALNDLKLQVDHRILDILYELLEECVFDYDQFLGDTDTPFIDSIYGPLRRARAKLIEEHKHQRQIFPTYITNLENLRKKIIKYRYRPKSHKQVFEATTKQLQYLHKFSELLIDYLENEWPKEFKLVKNLNKRPTSQPCWNEMILNMHNKLRSKRGLSHTEACFFISQLLGIVYPHSWAGDVDANASLIRAKIDKLNPQLV